MWMSTSFLRVVLEGGTKNVDHERECVGVALTQVVGDGLLDLVACDPRPITELVDLDPAPRAGDDAVLSVDRIDHLPTVREFLGPGRSVVAERDVCAAGRVG